MSAEPSVAVGDSGEQVSLLQERMQRLGYYHGSLDGNYGPHTEEAVRQLQELVGLERDGHVQEATWDAIEHQELLQGGSDQYGTEPSAGEGRQLSEDGQWWWDGVDWQPVGEQPAAEQVSANVEAGHAELQLSPDGQFQWDGSQWLPTAGGESLLASPDSLHAGDLHFDDALVAQFAGPMAAPGGPAGSATPSTDQELTGFATKSAELTTEHRTILARVAADLNAHPLTADGFVMLTGFADRRGKPGMNKDLAQRRADAVRDYLRQLVTDEGTRNNIRTQSMGEPNDGPEVDDPNLRKVEIEITRPSPVTPPPTSGPAIDLSPNNPTVKEAIKKQANKPTTGTPKPPVQPGVNLPPDFWKEIPKPKPKPEFAKQVSQWANEKLNTKALVKAVAGKLADGLGMDRARVERTLNDALDDAGEAGVKALLNKIAEEIAGPPRSR